MSKQKIDIVKAAQRLENLRIEQTLLAELGESSGIETSFHDVLCRTFLSLFIAHIFRNNKDMFKSVIIDWRNNLISKTDTPEQSELIKELTKKYANDRDWETS